MSREKINRENAKKSTGPRNIDATRFNALKHGLRAKGLTELDDHEAYELLVQKLMNQGVQAVKNEIAEQIALELVRLKRGAFLDAENITARRHPEVRSELFSNPLEGTVVEQGFIPALDVEVAQELVVYQRLRTSSLNNMLKLMNTFERLQRMDNGEKIPAPFAADISLTVEESSPRRSEASDSGRREEGVMSATEGEQSSSCLQNGTVGSMSKEGEGWASDDEIGSSERLPASLVETETGESPAAHNSSTSASLAAVQKDDLQRKTPVDGVVLPNEANSSPVSRSTKDSSPENDAGIDADDGSQSAVREPFWWSTRLCNSDAAP
jgi:hypothetical protein